MKMDKRTKLDIYQMRTYKWPMGLLLRRKMFNAINLHENACKIKMKYYLLLNNNGHKNPTA